MTTAHVVTFTHTESPYDEARLKAIRRRIAELRASREAAEPRNALDMMDVVWEVGAADEKVSKPASTDVADKGTSLASSSVPAGGDDLSAVDAGEVNGREAAFFTIVAVPVVLQVLGMMEHDNPAVPYFIAAANASVWFAALCIFVDWAAGSPSGIATQVKRWLPVSLRRALSPINPKSIFFTEEADQGRRGYYEGLVREYSSQCTHPLTAGQRNAGGETIRLLHLSPAPCCRYSVILPCAASSVSLCHTLGTNFR